MILYIENNKGAILKTVRTNLVNCRPQNQYTKIICFSIHAKWIIWKGNESNAICNSTKNNITLRNKLKKWKTVLKTTKHWWKKLRTKCNDRLYSEIGKVNSC